jgi:hypothetical protein
MSDGTIKITQRIISIIRVDQKNVVVFTLTTTHVIQCLHG